MKNFSYPNWGNSRKIHNLINKLFQPVLQPLKESRPTEPIKDNTDSIPTDLVAEMSFKSKFENNYNVDDVFET